MLRFKILTQIEGKRIPIKPEKLPVLSICSSSYTTATGMSALLSIKHNKTIRALPTGVYDSKFLWKKTFRLPIRKQKRKSSQTKNDLFREMLSELSTTKAA